MMRFLQSHNFNKITAYQLGWSMVGPPLMTVYCYVLGDLIIDTGLSHMQKEALTIASGHGVKRICLTHHHEDHSGNAEAIRQRLNTTVYGHPITAKTMSAAFKILPYQKYVWGKATPTTVDTIPDKIETPLGDMTPVHTPGHSQDHTCFYLEDAGVVFSGDLYLGDKIKYFRADEDMGQQINSLETILSLDFQALLCSHAPKMADGKRHLARKLDFLQNLYGNILTLWEKGMSAKQIFRSLRLREDYFIKYFCFGDVSMMNGVRSAIRHHLK